MSISRQASYFAAGSNRLFGWYHHVLTVPQLDCVAVICNPIGHEYAHCHRSIRHLADQLAASGIPALRFDYSGTGDSPGFDIDANRVGNWQLEIVGAIKFARELRDGNASGRTKVCLIGIRLGASLAALASESHPADFLVMWNPCVSGRRFVRELQAISSMSTAANELSTAIEQPMLESAGFVFSNDTISQLQAINLLDLKFNCAGKVLLLDRDDLSADTILHDQLVESGVEAEYRKVPGYAGMVAEPQFTVVPQQAIETITGWLSSHCAILGVDQGANPVATEDTLTMTSPSREAEPLTEQLCHFGADQHLFGILTKPNKATEKPFIVFFNAGCVHHIGPNRLYVTLCRHLASQGFPAFRFDLESLGDSVLRGAGRENHPYPDHAVSDSLAALNDLRQRFGATKFVVAGLCSGAHTAFHTALRSEAGQFVDVILINPLTFYWVEGMSLETAQHFWSVTRYKKSVNSAHSWRKLFTGRVDLLTVCKTLAKHVLNNAVSRYHAIGERFLANGGKQLSRDIRKLLSMKRRLNLIVSAGDPGKEIMLADARNTVTQSEVKGDLVVRCIAGGDHTFSRLGPRTALVQGICDLLLSRYADRPPR